MEKAKKAVAYLMIAMLSISCLSYTYVYASNIQLSDVKDGDWFKLNVELLIDKGIINGYTDGTFKPNNTVTKAQFIKMVITSIGYNNLQSGVDYWASPYIEKAITLQILTPRVVTSEEFDQPICRGDMAIIISKALKEGYVSNLEDYSKLLKDYANIKDVYKESVLKVYSKGIIGGYTDGEFKADNNLTRAEASTVLARMIVKLKRIQVELIFSEEDTNRLQGYEFSSGQSVTFGKATEDLGTFYTTIHKEVAKRYLEQFLYGIDYTKLQEDDIPWRLIYANVKCGNNTEEENNMIKYFIDNQIINEAEFITSDNLIYKSSTGSIMIRGILKYRYTSTLESNIQKNITIIKDVEVEIGVTQDNRLIVKEVKYFD